MTTDPDPETLPPPSRRSFAQRFLQPLLVPLLAIFSSLLLGAIVIVFTAESVAVGIDKVRVGYWGMIQGSMLTQRGLINTLVATTPLILTGLAVAIPFRTGLFNIGAEGQFIMGALFGTMVGVYLNLPPVIHLLAALMAGSLGGMLWGAIPGILRAWLGSHEVINTIMLNFVAIFFVNFMVRGPIRAPSPTVVQTLPILATAELPRLTGRLHLGFFIAILLAVVAYYFLFKTTWGFNLRTTGQNPDAAEYAGIRPRREYVVSMVLAGGLAGLAGTIEVQGLSRVLTEGYASGYGFDAIAVSLLAVNNPLAVIPSAFIFGALRIGGDFLQIRAGLSVHVISILRALILLFVAAPAIIRFVYRIPVKAKGVEGDVLTKGWGG
jgi:general nucleoside transport system permease protein